ncbi:DUF4157 domain-containing protein [Streptomyces sp. NPDC051016]|uniref:DUF4157 domain-containing protein n=1 Tax=Streptomyces sp. NPDC051016 TaxID=3365638 RepID=UPI00379EE8AA
MPAPIASPAQEAPAPAASPAQEAPAPIASPAQEVADAFHRHGPAAAAAVVGETRAAGSPLGTEVEARAGAHFGVSLGRVRLHDDAFAHDTAALVRANAFTVGDHVFFGAGMLDTGSSAGRLRLLHEIAHTLQHRRPGGSGTDPEALERDADRVTAAGAAGVPGMLGTGPVLLREPTYPRRATSTQMLREADRVLGQRRDEDAADPTLRMWSRVPSNFEPDVTCGVLARRVWTSVFLRHFTEPDQRPGVESAHPRYLYSRDYGWIDGQHFFAFIDFAENQVRAAGSRQGGLERATAQGSVIEGNQQRVKDKVILGAPPATDVTRLMQVRGPNTGLFVLPRAAAGTATRLGADLMAWQNLTGAQSELFDQLDPVQRSKFWTDSAKSAWSYEDIVSNQLGTRFFLEHGEAINALPPAARPAAFEARLAAFFGSVHVVDDQAVLDSAARDLPGQERYRPPTMDEARARQLHPELFTLPK